MAVLTSACDAEQRTGSKEIPVHDCKRVRWYQGPKLLGVHPLVGAVWPKLRTREQVRAQRHQCDHSRERISAGAVPPCVLPAKMVPILVGVWDAERGSIDTVDRQPTPRMC